MLLVGFFASVVVVAIGAANDLLTIRQDLQAGERRLDTLDIDTIRSRGLRGVIDDAADDLEHAERRADDSTFLSLLAPIPVIGAQIDGVRELTAVGGELGREARRSGRSIDAALERAGGDPGARVELLDTVLAELDRIESVARRIELDDDGGLVGPLSGAHRRVDQALEKLPLRFDDLRADVAAVRDLLSGPTSYLVLAGNNAEMRAGAGMPLSAGVATFADGRIDLSEFVPTVSRDFRTTADGGPNASDGLEALQAAHPFFFVGANIPSTSVVPDFPTAAPLHAGVAAATQGWNSSGVVHIDAIALTKLLEVTGPVEVDGVVYDAENAAERILYEAYLEFETFAERDARLAAQDRLARALFDELQRREVDLLDVVAALQDAAGGRHLMAWSADPRLQSLYVDLGVAGEIEEDDLLVSVQNTAANKMDWLIQPRYSLTSELSASGDWIVTIDVDVPNPDDAETSPYIEGGLPDLPDGRHRVLVTVHAPPDTTFLDTAGGKVTDRGRVANSDVVGLRFVIDKGDTQSASFRLRLPKELRRLDVRPDGRARPPEWTVDNRSLQPDGEFSLFRPTPVSPLDSDHLVPAAIGVLLALAGVSIIGRGATRPSLRSATFGIDAVTGATLVTLGLAFAIAAAIIASS